jgi:hypothetical protein
MKPVIIFFRESVLQSVISDICTFVIILVSLYIGDKYMGGGGFVMFFLWIMALLAIMTKGNTKKITFTSKEALIKYINETIKD